MNILFELNHPAHYHYFKNFIKYLQEENHFVLIVSREKDVLLNLLEHDKINHITISKPSKGMIGNLMELVSRIFKLLKLNNKYHFDIAFGTISCSYLTLFSNVKSFLTIDDDDNLIRLLVYLAFPFCSKILQPDYIHPTILKNKRVFFNSYLKLGHLHPNVFQPDISVLKNYNLQSRRFIIIRLSAMKAFHDTGAVGLSNDLISQIVNIANKLNIIFSYENKKTFQIKPWDMHHVMSFAAMVISDSQTMSAEAALLGVPSIRYNSFVGKISFHEELEHRYGLTYGYRPGQEKEMLERIKKLLEMENVYEIWSKRKEKMLSEKVDFTSWLIYYFEKEIKK